MCWKTAPGQWFFTRPLTPHAQALAAPRRSHQDLIRGTARSSAFDSGFGMAQHRSSIWLPEHVLYPQHDVTWPFNKIYGQDWGCARNGMINVLRRHISMRRRSVVCALGCPWMSQDKFLESSVGKVNLLRTSCVSAFSLFSLFWPVWSIHVSSCHGHVHFSTLYASLNETLIEVWVICSMGPVDFITSVNPKWNPTKSMVLCSIGPGHVILKSAGIGARWFQWGSMRSWGRAVHQRFDHHFWGLVHFLISLFGEDFGINMNEPATSRNGPITTGR